MNARWKSGTAALALVLTMLACRSGAEDAKASASPEAQAKAFAEAGKPGPEHAKLQPLAGSWTYTCKCWMDPDKSPIEMTGTIERKWILGDRFIEERIAGTGFDGKPGFEGFGLLGYDKGQKKYTSTWACNMGTGASTGVGTAETSGRFSFQTTCSCPVLNKTVQRRDEIRIETQDRIVTEFYKIEDGKEVKAMEIVAIRKK